MQMRLKGHRTACSLVLTSILLVAVMRGALYASFMPPWGLIDEEQHVDYIQHLVEEHAIPVVGQTYLSGKIIDSLFATRRWEVFRWPTPASRDPREMGFEGHSYEGYQPPLYYILLAPLYVALPGDILIKLFALRWAMVGLSLLTVWMTYRIAQRLFPQSSLWPLLASLLLIVIPERTMAVSRVNNDVLLEVVATAFLWVCTSAILEGISIRRARLLGVLFGLGVLTKMSMLVLAVALAFVFYANRRLPSVRRSALWAGGLGLILILPMVLRNLWLYGDLTGFGAFRQFAAFSPPGFSGPALVQAIADLFRNSWVIWWRGATVGSEPFINALYGLLALSSAASLVGLVRFLRAQYHSKSGDRDLLVVLMYLLAILGYASAILYGYFDGEIPVVQGRFLLPVICPIAILFVLGLSQSRYSITIYVATVGILLVADALSLFGNLLPYFYFWSTLEGYSAEQTHRALNWLRELAHFYGRLLSDKPRVMAYVLPGLTVGYLASLAFVFLRIRKLMLTTQRLLS